MMTKPSGTVEAAGTPRPMPVVRTFLIADVRGYTQFTNEQGVPAAARLADRFAVLCKAIVSKHDGEVIELRGDEALAVFSSPRSALLAGVELQGRFREEMAADPTLPLRVGMGIDTGEVVRVQGGFRGRALNLAARLCSLAGPGEVFSTEEVVQQAERIEGLAYVERGRVQLKGFQDPIRVIHILAQQDLPEHFPPLVSLVAKPSNLPLQTTPFIGREREVGEVAELLRREEVRLVTLTGEGGTGKTRLALQVGGAVLEDFERGAFFVNLAPLADPDLVASTIASTLKVQEVPGQDILQTLSEYLHDRQLLLVLDNFEHLLPAATVVHDLLVACPRLTVLVTSRAILHLSAEHEHPVPPLAVPDPTHLPDLEQLTQYEAVALFIERARTVKPSFAVTNENAPAVAEICYRLDGLPLAIELAAARIRLFPPQALLGRLSHRLTFLTGGAKDLPTRQQTLRGAIDWSYSLLSQEEQTLFAQLSVFAGGCSFEAAEVVCNQDGDLLEGLESLVEKSLVRQEGEEEPHFGMLETIREYAQEKLLEQGDDLSVGEAHAFYYLELVEEAEPELEGPDIMRWLGRLDVEHDNLRTALAWLLSQDRSEEAVRLAGALSGYWNAHGYLSEARRLLDEALVAAPDVSRTVRAKLLFAAFVPAYLEGEMNWAEAVLTESLALYREVHDKRGMGRALNALSRIAVQRHDFEQARALIEEGLALSREAGDAGGAALAMQSMGTLASEEGNLDKAQEIFDANVASLRRIGLITFLAGELINVGWVALQRGDYARAQEALEEALALKRDNRIAGIANIHCNLGYVALEQGNLDRALEHFDDSLTLASEMRWVALVVEVLDGVGQVAALHGRAEEAAELFGTVEALGHAYVIHLSRTERAQERADLTRAALGEASWERAFSRGQALSMEAAVALAQAYIIEGQREDQQMMPHG